jgi:hypothetical protein
MCIIPQGKLSSDDLEFLSASRFAHREPDEEAIQRSLDIHERSGPQFGPVPVSQIVRFVPYRRASVRS